MFASDALMLLEMGLITAVAGDENARTPQSHEEAEQLARNVRERIGVGDDPLLSLGHTCEQLGLYTYAAPFGENGPDGGCVEVGPEDTNIAVAVINGDAESGRRRMTLAHELGHWLCGDAYDMAANADCERMISSFAIHFLVPRSGAIRVWNANQRWSNWDRILAVAATYRLSWSATVNHMKNLGLITPDERWSFLGREPRRGDYVRLELSWEKEPESPYLSPGFAAACVEGYTTGRLTAARTIELLRGTMNRDDLPEREMLTLDDLRKSFTGHGD